jgi:hypothetical protein
MGDLAEWLGTVTTIGYTVGVLVALLFSLRVLSRLGSKVTSTGAPDPAVEERIGSGSLLPGLALGTAIVLTLGALSVLAWHDRSWHVGDFIMNSLRRLTPNGPFLVLMGSSLAFWGLRRRRAGDRGPFDPDSLGSKLVAWKVAPAGSVSDVERRVRAYQRALGAVTTIAIGLAIFLAGVAMSAAAFMGSPALSSAVWFMNACVLAQLIGGGVGYPVAAHLEQRRLPAGPRYADLRRRRLSDYRSPRLRWLVLMAIAVQTAAAGTFLLVEGARVALLMPLLGALAFVVGELHMWSAARVARTVVARTVVTDDPATARRCDDLVRAGVIANLQRWQLFCITCASLIGTAVAAEPGYARTGASGMLLVASTVALLYSGLCTVGLLAFEERLGGRVTGWWGKPMPE